MIDYHVFPRPRIMRTLGERLDLSSSSWITIDPAFSSTLKKHTIDFCQAVNPAFAAPLTVTAGCPQSGQVFLAVRRVLAGKKAEGYSLAATRKGIVLEAADDRGAFYGLQTLRQIVDQAGSKPAAFRIDDYPDFPNRGFMLDISRCKVPTMETLYRYVDTLALLKMNQFQLYTEHTFAFSGHEKVWNDASPMTAGQIIALDRYCSDRFIELVPNFNSFGHFDRWLRYPEYFSLAESPDGFNWPQEWGGGRMPWGWVLKPNKETIKFLDPLYGEMLPNFTSRYLNVGCDETFELGTGWSKPLCEKLGKERVYLEFLLKIHKLARKHGRKMMFWGDIILHQPALISKLPKDIIALNWGYDALTPFDREGSHFAKSGVPYYVCPGTSSWRSLTGLAHNSILNCANAAQNGLKHGAIGYLNTDWGDEGHHQYLPISYTGMLAGAGYSWSFAANKDADLVEAMNRLVFKDTTGATGKLLYDIGRVCELAPKPPRIASGQSLWQWLLFRDHPTDDYGPSLKGLHIVKCLAALDELESRTSGIRPQVADGALVKAELTNALNMAQCGCLRGLYLLNDKPKSSAVQFNKKIRHVIGMHEQLWLARNRVGGLRESCDYLRKKAAKID